MKLDDARVAVGNILRVATLVPKSDNQNTHNMVFAVTSVQENANLFKYDDMSQLLIHSAPCCFTTTYPVWSTTLLVRKYYSQE